MGAARVEEARSVARNYRRRNSLPDCLAGSGYWRSHSSSTASSSGLPHTPGPRWLRTHPRCSPESRAVARARVRVVVRVMAEAARARVVEARARVVVVKVAAEMEVAKPRRCHKQSLPLHPSCQQHSCARPCTRSGWSSTCKFCRGPRTTCSKSTWRTPPRLCRAAQSTTLLVHPRSPPGMHPAAAAVARAAVVLSHGRSTSKHRTHTAA